jgi:hypothetical protein
MSEILIPIITFALGLVLGIWISNSDHGDSDEDSEWVSNPSNPASPLHTNF